MRLYILCEKLNGCHDFIAVYESLSHAETIKQNMEENNPDRCFTIFQEDTIK